MVCAAFLGARAEYVALNWALFSADLARVYNMDTGGLDWHGAVIGALLVLWMADRCGWATAEQLLPRLTPALPLIGLAAWTACRPVGCAYGAEVATLAYYPAWAVTEGRDIFGIIAPRYDTHTYGQALAWLLLVITGGRWLIGRVPRWGVWGQLALWSSGMFGIGFWRADYALVWGGLRADQWQDLLLLALALVMLWRSRRPHVRSTAGHTPRPPLLS